MDGRTTALLFQLLDLLFASVIHSTGANELDDALKFFGVKPRAVLAADIDHDARASCEINALHQFAAFRAFDVTHFVGNWRRQHDGGPEHGGLLFAVGADFLERKRVQPKPFAFGAFAKDRFADGNLPEFDIFAFRARHLGVLNFGAIGARSAQRAEARALKNHAEAGGASDRGEARAAMFAGGRVRTRGSAAHRTIENAGVCHLARIHGTGFKVPEF
jgi:hypothetical protein